MASAVSADQLTVAPYPLGSWTANPGEPRLLRFRLATDCSSLQWVCSGVPGSDTILRARE